MSFVALPTELRLCIIEEYLGIAQASSSSTTVPARHHVRVKQVANLALVSRSLDAVVAYFLWRNIRINRPSSLLQLHARLKRRPGLGSLVQKLHIGPDNELHGNSWPLRLTPPESRLQTTLVTDVQLPRWCQPGREFRITNAGANCQEVMVKKAIQAAMTDLDVDPGRRGYSTSSRSIGVRAWTARIFLLQAALDLYLLEMKRIEDARHYEVTSWQHRDAAYRYIWSQPACLASSCSHYPSLKILPRISDSSPFANAANGEYELFVIAESQLWQHLLQRSGPADHFDYLVRFTRSTSESLGMNTPNEYRRVKQALGGPLPLPLRPYDAVHQCAHRHCAAQLQRSDLVQEDGESFPSWIDEQSDAEDTPAERGQQSHGALASHRAEDLLEACRSILAVTPNVTSVSLTGCFHRALPSLCAPGSLRSLTIGPRLHYWDDALPILGPLRFDNLARLRIVGNMTRSDAHKIARGLPTAKEVQWEMSDRNVSQPKIEDTITNLQGYGLLSSSTAQTQSLPCKRAHEGSAEDQADTSVKEMLIKAPQSLPATTRTPTPSTTSAPRIVLLLLHLNIASRILNDPNRSQSIRDAWTNGSTLPGTRHAVRIAASDAVLPDGYFDGSSDGSDAARLHEKSQLWWEEG